VCWSTTDPVEGIEAAQNQPDRQGARSRGLLRSPWHGRRARITEWNEPGLFDAAGPFAKSGMLVVNDPSFTSVVVETFIPLPRGAPGDSKYPKTIIVIDIKPEIGRVLISGQDHTTVMPTEPSGKDRRPPASMVNLFGRP